MIPLVTFRFIDAWTPRTLLGNSGFESVKRVVGQPEVVLGHDRSPSGVSVLTLITGPMIPFYRS